MDQRRNIWPKFPLTSDWVCHDGSREQAVRGLAIAKPPAKIYVYQVLWKC